MSSPFAHCTRIPRLAGMLALLTTACITDLRVGIEKGEEPDAAVPMGEPDAGEDPEPEPCEDEDCGPEPEDSPLECPDFARAAFVCERNDAGVCAWRATECVDPNAPCEQIDCEGPLLINPDRLACSDGSMPKCERDPATSLCGFQCPPSGACGTQAGSGCASGEYCWFKEGLCGAGSGGQCTLVPNNCNPAISQQAVCGCDGQTYASPCEAAFVGVNIAFVGACSEEPGLCDTCTGAAPDPSETRIACDDGVHASGPNCIHGGDGACHWQWLECPNTRSCASEGLLPLEPGRCYTADDCAELETCEGASLCPCDAECFAGDTPGYCKSH